MSANTPKEPETVDDEDSTKDGQTFKDLIGVNKKIVTNPPKLQKIFSEQFNNNIAKESLIKLDKP